MAKLQTMTIDEAQRRLRELEHTYGSGAQITVGPDLEIEMYNRPDLQEETPEQSQKRFERQQKEAEDKPQEVLVKLER